ncbi:RNA polymerase sigma factor [Actinomadura sp. ATCC 39365]
MITNEDSDPPEYESFETFFKQQFSRVMALLLSHNYSWEEALEATVEAMARAGVGWEAIRSPYAWVCKVALRQAAKAAKHDRRGLTLAIEGGWAGSSHEDEASTSVIEEKSEVVALLACLPDRQRAVMACYYDGLNPDEIAGILGMKRGTVNSNLRHARRKLKAVLRDREEGR